MDMSLIHSIASGLLIPSIVALVKLYGDVKVLSTEYKNLNQELQEFKHQQVQTVEALGNRIEKRLDKLENLIERLFTWERENKKD